MKRYIRSAEDNLNSQRADELAHQIEQLFKSEDIPYIYVDVLEEGEFGDIFIAALVYGDWRNDCDRAGELVEAALHPDRSDFEERDLDDYPDLGLSPGSDSCVTAWSFHWDV